MVVADLISKKEKIALIGLGYVGLPVALAFAKKVSVIGFDINVERIELMKQSIDPSNELNKESFENCDITFTNSLDVLKEATFFIVTVPTPVDEHHVPDLTAVLKASESVGKVLKKGDYVVYESTVYPGCTEEDCLPILENLSGLKNITDFKLGYSPERINPGDKTHTIDNVVKVVSASDAASLQVIADVYSIIVAAGVYQAPSIKVAEAAKILENTQRDLNIGLMNELSIIFDRMKIDTHSVIETAGTKWNFVKYYPGLVGGHCIGVDPYYLTYKAAKLGYTSQVITAGRFINDGMAKYVAEKILIHLLNNVENVRTARVLVMGLTFKENVTDVRNSKVAEVIKYLQSYLLTVHVVDPLLHSTDVKKYYGFDLEAAPANDYDAVVIAVPHQQYLSLNDLYFTSITKPSAVIADLKGIYRNKITSRSYWSL